MEAINIPLQPPANDCIRGAASSFQQCLTLVEDKQNIGVCFSLSIYNLMVCIDKVNKTKGNNK